MRVRVPGSRVPFDFECLASVMHESQTHKLKPQKACCWRRLQDITLMTWYYKSMEEYDKVALLCFACPKSRAWFWAEILRSSCGQRGSDPCAATAGWCHKRQTFLARKDVNVLGWYSCGARDIAFRNCGCYPCTQQMTNTRFYDHLFSFKTVNWNQNRHLRTFLLCRTNTDWCTDRMFCISYFRTSYLMYSSVLATHMDKDVFLIQGCARPNQHQCPCVKAIGTYQKVLRPMAQAPSCPCSHWCG